LNPSPSSVTPLTPDAADMRTRAGVVVSRARPPMPGSPLPARALGRAAVVGNRRRTVRDVLTQIRQACPETSPSGPAPRCPIRCETTRATPSGHPMQPPVASPRRPRPDSRPALAVSAPARPRRRRTAPISNRINIPSHILRMASPSKPRPNRGRSPRPGCADEVSVR
jgi:hypothetical protein